MNIPALIRILSSKGMSAADIADVIELTTPKGTGAERTRRWREKTAAEAVTVTPVTVTPVTPVTKDAPAPTYTRGEDNLSRLEDKPNLTTQNASEGEGAGVDLDWPSEARPSRAYLDSLEASLRLTAGEALDPTATKLFSLAPILALGASGKGPPCDLQADILPTIRARSARASPRSVRSWDFYTDAIREARDRRLIGAPETRPVHQGPRHERPDQPSPKRSAREDNLARSLAASEVAARSRAFG